MSIEKKESKQSNSCILVLEAQNFLEWRIFQESNIFLKNWDYPNPLDLMSRLEGSPSNFYAGILF
jgi:hypothetical protein